MDARFIDDAVKNDRRIKSLTIVCKSEGDVYWYQIPNTEWKANEIATRISEAKTWYDKYCIHLNFSKFATNPQKASHRRIQREIDALVATYTAQVARIPRARAPQREQHLFNVQATVNAIEHQIRRIIGRKKMLVLFLDEWYVKTGVGPPTHWRENRISATRPDALTAGIDRYDRGSRNILTHELTHALRHKVKRNAARRCRRDFAHANGVTREPRRQWHDHYAGQNQDKAMSRPNRTRAFRPSHNPSTDVLSVAEYMYIQQAGYVKSTPGCDCRKKKEKDKKKKERVRSKKSNR